MMELNENLQVLDQSSDSSSCCIQMDFEGFASRGSLHGKHVLEVLGPDGQNIPRIQNSLIKFVYYDLSTFVYKNIHRLFDKYAVARPQNTMLLSKVRRRFFQILWPSQKTLIMICNYKKIEMY